MSSPQKIKNNSGVEYSEESLNKLFDLQKEQFALQREKIALLKQKDASNKEMALASIDANLQVSKDSPKERKSIRHTFVLGGFLLLIFVLGFVVYLLENGHKDLVLTCFKALSYLVVYFLGYYSKTFFNQRKDNESPEIDVIE